MPPPRGNSNAKVALIAGCGACAVGLILVLVFVAQSPPENENARRSQPRRATQTPARVPQNQPPKRPTTTSNHSPNVSPRTPTQPINAPSRPPNTTINPANPPTPAVEPVPSEPTRPAVVPKPTVPAGPKIARSTMSWLGSPSDRRVGAIPIEGEDLVVYHYSWMTQVLPYLGHQQLYDRFDFRRPWTNDPNLSLAAVVVPEFLNPADDRRVWTGRAYRGLALTHFVGVAGVEDGRNEVAALLPRSDPRAGVFGYHDVAKLSDITDGTRQTLMIVGSGEFANPWVQGGGATVRGARQPYFDNITGFGSKGVSKRGTFGVMADGSTRFISADIDPAVFRAMCTTHGRDSVATPDVSKPLSGFSFE